MTFEGTLSKKLLDCEMILISVLSRMIVTNSDSPTALFIETFAPITEHDVCMLIRNSKNLHLGASILSPLYQKSYDEPLIPVIKN